MNKTFKRILGVSVLLLLVLCTTLQAANGFYVSGGKLYDANGSQFIMRGISHAHVWYTDKSAQAIPDIKSVGANCVRLVLSNGVRWTKTSSTDLANLITLCKNNKLIAIPEVHDTTGYGEQAGASTLAQAASYWAEVKSVLQGQEKYVIINIGNEPYGNVNAANWVADTKNAIIAMRNSGFTHTLLVDATNWGQDWSFVTRDNAQAIVDSDTLKNTVVAIHMYGVFDTAAEITAYISSFTSRSIPLVVGEFGNNHSDGDPDEDTIMATCQSSGIGYMGWSWCGNSSDVAYLDMVNAWVVTSLTTWGTRIINGANGIKSTSKECSVYSSVISPTTTRTATSVTRTATRTATSLATATRTATSGTASRTATRTVTATSGTASRTATATAGTSPVGCTCDAGCSTIITITPNFSKDGAGQFCYSATSLGSYINSWNLTALKVNGVDFTNKWVAKASLPAAIGGLYYVFYNSAVSYGHFEAMN